jgi:hypothetical protein
MAWTQAFRRSPIDLRPLARVPAEDNAKALALFILGMAEKERAQPDPTRRQEMRELALRLVALRCDGPQGEGGWGYPFDWQSRAFFARRGSPNIVATAFSSLALLSASRLLKEPSFCIPVREACEFVNRSLGIRDKKGNLFFAYVPDDRSIVYNATLLGARLLAKAGIELVEARWTNLSLEAARSVVATQRDDGSWTYGPLLRHRWIDSFHTGYNLTALETIATSLGASELDGAIGRGYGFYRNRFFRDDAAPRYYPGRNYPVDIHSAAVAIETFLKLGRFDPLSNRWASNVARWTVDRMRDHSQGYFFYQRHPFYTIRIPYMRWSQAWMYYALSLLTVQERPQTRRPARESVMVVVDRNSLEHQ